MSRLRQLILASYYSSRFTSDRDNFGLPKLKKILTKYPKTSKIDRTSKFGHTDLSTVP